MARGGLDLAGLRGVGAILAHLAAVLGSEQALLPGLGVGSPTPSYGAKAMGTDALHHTVYAVATSAAYDALRSS
jgi:hypothetical protein